MSTSVPPPGYVPPAATGPAPSESEPPPGRGPSHRPAWAPAAIAGLALAALAGLAFVLFGSTASPLTDQVARAATVSSQAPGYRMNMGLDMSVPGLAAPITASGTGVLDLRDHAASMSMAIDFSQLPQAAQALGSTTMQMRMVLDRAAMYIKFPSALAGKIPGLGGKPWVEMNLAKLSGLPGLSSVTSNPTMSDPSQMLRYLRAASDGVTNEGHEEIDGIATTHYRADVSLDHLPDSVPSAERGAIEQALSRLRQATRLHDFPMDVWIDAHHLVRRMRMAITLGTPTGEAIRETVTADITDYGPQPRPTPPPAGQVQDLSNLIGSAGGLGTGSG